MGYLQVQIGHTICEDVNDRQLCVKVPKNSIRGQLTFENLINQLDKQLVNVW